MVKAASNIATRSTVSGRGQVTIPADVRNAAGIMPGSVVVFSRLPDGRIILRVKSGTLADLKGIVKTDRHATDAQIRDLREGTLVKPRKAPAARAKVDAGVSAAGLSSKKK
jgi:AbrB family looped-hinge helix DNA binding protein